MLSKSLEADFLSSNRFLDVPRRSRFTIFFIHFLQERGKVNGQAPSAPIDVFRVDLVHVDFKQEVLH